MDANREALTELGAYLEAKLGADVTRQEVTRTGELVVHVPASGLLKLSKLLRDDASCLFKQCTDICGVDWPEREKRFDVVYNLLSFQHNLRIRLIVQVAEEDTVPSVVSVWPSAGWYEREVWDMYGVFFTDHPDLRRILTDYGFDGHPQRKDFPLTGYIELRYDDEQRRVVYEPVQLRQDFRTFDFASPWEGMTPVLPGDEKATGETAGAEGDGGKA